MRLLALFLGNLQGPACVIQPAIARQIIKACHHNLPFFFFIKPIIMFLLQVGGRGRGGKENKEVKLGQEMGQGSLSQAPLPHQLTQEPPSWL